ncbi:hypothetical protein JXI42_02945 [bacterium]|nr:hypothetical protein [bacterium]
MTLKTNLFVLILFLSFIILLSVNQFGELVLGVFFENSRIICSPLYASVPEVIHYQAGLSDDSGTALTGTHILTFRLYAEETGGIPIWTETHEVDMDSLGFYDVMLGSVTSFESASVDFFLPYWLSLSVDGGVEMGRHEIGTSPYAFHAQYADSIAGIYNYVKTINEIDADETGNIEFIEGTNITLTEIPATNQIQISATGDAGGISSINDIAPDAEGNLLLEEGENIIITGILDSNKVRISSGGAPHPNRVTLGNSTEHGALFVYNQGGELVTRIESAPDSTQGVLAKSFVDDKSAIRAEAHGAGYATGIIGYTFSDGDGAAGVYGSALRSSGVTSGILGETYSTSDYASGIWGSAEGTEGRTYGVGGVNESSSDSAVGVYGRVAAGNHTYGVYGLTRSTGSESAGVYGKAINGETNYGVLAETYSNDEVAAALLARALSTDGSSAKGIVGYAQGNERDADGVWGIATGHGRNYGVKGMTQSNHDSSAGVYGVAGFLFGSGLVFGVMGETFSEAQDAAGIYGLTRNVSEQRLYGVRGETRATGEHAAGVYGRALGNTGKTAGVYGYTASADTGASGILGWAGQMSPAIYGVQGFTSGSDDAAGVYGYSVNGVSFGVLGKSTSMVRNTAGVMGIANGDAAYPSKIYGIRGSTNMDADTSAGVWGEATGALQKVYGVYGTCYSNNDSAAGVYGLAINNANGVKGKSSAIGYNTAGVFGINEAGAGVIGEGQIGVLGRSDLLFGVAILSDGVFVVGEPYMDDIAFKVTPGANETHIYGMEYNPITIFGGSSNRVAIQKVNGGPTPTLYDNNFMIEAEAPLLVTNGAHGVTISCPECCTSPCGGEGGGCVCESTHTIGSGESPGELKIINSGGSVGAKIYYEPSGDDCVIKAGTFGVNGKLLITGSAEGDTIMAASCASVNLNKHVYTKHDVCVLGDLIVYGFKSFQTPHPEIEDKDIRFYCAESDEVMIEHRGTLELNDGYGESQLPHEFVLMSEPGTYSIMCTPQDWENNGVGAKVDDNGKIMIKELAGGEGNFKVAFTVYATRKGYKDHPVVVDKQVMR